MPSEPEWRGTCFLRQGLLPDEDPVGFSWPFKSYCQGLGCSSVVDLCLDSVISAHTHKSRGQSLQMFSCFETSFPPSSASASARTGPQHHASAQSLLTYLHSCGLYLRVRAGQAILIAGWFESLDHVLLPAGKGAENSVLGLFPELGSQDGAAEGSSEF
jgi:hypothetical protein